MIIWLIKQLSHPIRISKQISQSVKTLATLLIQKWDSFLTSETGIWAILREQWFRNLKKNFSVVAIAKKWFTLNWHAETLYWSPVEQGLSSPSPPILNIITHTSLHIGPCIKIAKHAPYIVLWRLLALTDNDSMKLRMQTMSVSKIPFSWRKYECWVKDLVSNT